MLDCFSYSLKATQEIVVYLGIAKRKGRSRKCSFHSQNIHMFMNSESVTCGEIGTVVPRFLNVHSIWFFNHIIRQLKVQSD